MMVGRLERELRQVPRVVSVAITPRHVFVLPEPEADVRVLEATVTALLEARRAPPQLRIISLPSGSIVPHAKQPARRRLIRFVSSRVRRRVTLDASPPAPDEHERVSVGADARPELIKLKVQRMARP